MSGAGKPWEDFAAPAGSDDGPWADFSAPAHSQDAAPKGGFLRNVGAGAVEGITSIPEFLYGMAKTTFPTLKTIESLAKIGLSASGQKPPQDPGAAITHGLNRSLGDFTGFNPEDVKAATTTDRIGRGIGAGASSMVFPGGGIEGLAGGARAILPSLARMGRTAVTGAAGGLGGGVASEAIPDEYPTAKAAVSVLGAIAAGGAAEVAGPAARAAARSARQLTAPMTQAGRETMAAQALRARSSNPVVLEETLAAPKPTIIPGSKPTTFQQTGDMGLGALEREVATKAPEKFTQRRAEQNAARTEALAGVQSVGDPKDVATLFRDQMDAIDSETETAIAAATKRGQGDVANVDAATHAGVQDATGKAQSAAGQIGGSGTPEGYGTGIRNLITQAEDTAKARVSKLYDAIDPDGNLTGNMTTTSTAAKEIMGELSPTSMPMTAAEADVFGKAAELPAMAPARDLIELSKYVNATMKAEQRANGQTPAYARLAQLRGAIQHNIDNTIADRVASEAKAVADGSMAAEDTLSTRLKAEADEWKSQRAETGRAVGDNTGQSAGSGPSAISGEAGAASPSEQRPGDVAGSEGVPEQPTFDEAAAQRLAEASKAHAERKQTFGISPISDITKSSGMKGQFVLPSGAVPGKVFFPGPKGFQAVQATLKASPDALPVIEDYAAMSLRRAALNDAGVIDPTKFSRWADAHQDALRALPEATQARFASAATAGDTVAEASAGRLAALKAANAKAAEEVTAATAARKARMAEAKKTPGARLAPLTEPEDITKTVGSIFNGRTAVSDMKALASAVEGNPQAKAGLRQAVADHISKNFISNAEAGTSGKNLFKGDAFQTFVKRNRSALSAVFTPEEVAVLDRIAADLKQANRSIVAVKLPGASNTAQDAYGIAANAKPTVLDRIITEAAAAAGGGAGFAAGGPLGAALGWIGVKAVNHARTAGLESLDDLMAEAMLNPELAAELLRKAPAQANSGQATTLSNRLRRIGLGVAATGIGAANR